MNDDKTKQSLAEISARKKNGRTRRRERLSSRNGICQTGACDGLDDLDFQKRPSKGIRDAH